MPIQDPSRHAKKPTPQGVWAKRPMRRTDISRHFGRKAHVYAFGASFAGGLLSGIPALGLAAPLVAFPVAALCWRWNLGCFWSYADMNPAKGFARAVLAPLAVGLAVPTAVYMGSNGIANDRAEARSDRYYYGDVKPPAPRR